jgi:hypothetical protein
MADDNIAALKAKYAGLSKNLFPQKGLLKIEEGKPLKFFVLCGDYSTKGFWVHPVGVHYIKGKQIVCSEEGKEPTTTCYICERIREMRAGGLSENQIFPYLGPEKYAMNVLERGEETPRILLAPTAVGREIIETFEAVLNEEGINIFDPMKSTLWMVTRSKEAGRTQHKTDFEVEPQPIITGDNVEERIARILRAAANLNDRFRLPTLREQQEAWAKRCAVCVCVCIA